MRKIRKNDKVKIISGKDAGRESTVERVFPKEGLILVKDVNQVTKHQKKSGKQEGGRIKIAKPMALANVMLICSKCGKAVRVGVKVIDGQKKRACKKCGEII